jgi:signal transduction histidine kinase
LAEVHQIETVWKTRPAILVTLNDITDRKHLEKQKQDFLNTVSHDLRTPLTSIKESLMLISSGSVGSVSSDQKEFLSLALKNIDRLKRMIDSLLVMARLEAGQFTLNKECIDIELLIDEVLASFAPLAANAGIELKKSFPGVTLLTFADGDKIVEVLNNLISNSLKFTSKGYVEVSVKDHDSFIECSVYDTGFGMTPDQLSRIFNKFQQFNHKNHSSEKGIGLGLAISKGIIEAHDGVIRAESKENEWTRFTFTLPKYIPAADSR